jgi:class 3 adenylate cyclase
VHAPPTRVLATILCAAGSGSRPGHASLEQLNDVVAAEATRFGATSVQPGSAGVFAAFDGPARAIRCGRAIAAAARDLGRPVRVGLHTGECDLAEGPAAGLVAGISARVAALGGAGEVLVSRTLVDLVAGSGLEFEDRGSHPLTNGSHHWRVFAAQQDAGLASYAAADC